MGGLGPYASNEFLRCIYEANSKKREQDAPVVFLHSDPTAPDRTTALLNGRRGELFSYLVAAVERLISIGATRVVVCCFTMHHLVPYLPPTLRRKVISLVDTGLAAVLKRRRVTLVLCSSGSATVGIFPASPLWKQSQGLLRFLDPADQMRMHDLIYRVLKRNQEPRHLINHVRDLAQRYEVDTILAACTELHILSRQAAWKRLCGRTCECIDPLSIIARSLHRESLWRQD